MIRSNPITRLKRSIAKRAKRLLPVADLSHLQQQVEALQQQLAAYEATSQLDAANLRRLREQFDLVVGDPDLMWLYRNREERMDATVPSLFAESRREFHQSRYHFACDYVKNLDAADIACGTGYGSEILVKCGGAKSVIGVDLCDEAVDYARRIHSLPETEYRCAPGERSGLASESLDTVVSFETIEHVPCDQTLLQEFHRILRPGGRIVCSTPNEWPLSMAQYHERTYNLHQFETAVSRYFEIESMYNQNSGCEWEYNRSQKAGIVPTTSDNHELAECFICVAVKR